MPKSPPRWRREKRKEPEDDRKAVRLRLGLIRFAVLAAFAILAVQLWKMQIVSADYYRVRAEHNRLRPDTITPHRGTIISRDGEPLVRNIGSFSVFLTPADLPTERTDEVVGRLAHILGEPKEEILAAVEARRARRQIFDRIPVKTDIDPHTALYIMEMQAQWLPGVTVRQEELREYLGGQEMSHILGYLGRISAEEFAQLQDKGYQMSDRIGKAGVEASYEEELHGVPGRQYVEVDVNGKPIGEPVYREEPVPGHTLRLSIDMDLQRKITEILQTEMARSRQAVAIAGNPKTGEIYAMVSLPTFDNNLFTRGISQKDWDALTSDKRYPMINHAIGASLPPGSIYKMIVAAAALQEGVATPRTTIVSRGAIKIKSDFDEKVEYTFPDWATLGPLDLYGGIAQSSDVYFYYLSGGYAPEGFRGLGLERLVRYSRAFGLGAPTGIDLPGEVNGLVPTDEWKRKTWKEGWLLGDTYNLGIGQGYLLVTPIQMWNVVNAVANGGTLYQPRVVHDILDANNNVIVPFTPRVTGRVGVDDANLKEVREGMRQAVLRGTARNANLPGLSLAAKTGTAEYGERDPVTGQYANSHAWFTGFAPFDDPDFSLLVYLDEGLGSADATPTAARILEYYFTQRKGRP